MDGNIVVGVDGSAASLAALRLAVREAKIRGVGVDAVRIWSMPIIDGVAALGPAVLPWTELADSARVALDRAITTAVGDEPEVAIRRFVVEGSPAYRLVGMAADAPLIIVGSRGEGGFLGLLLGSTAQQVLHHAPCPVIVVPEPAIAT